MYVIIPAKHFLVRYIIVEIENWTGNLILNYDQLQSQRGDIKVYTNTVCVYVSDVNKKRCENINITFLLFKNVPNWKSDIFANMALHLIKLKLSLYLIKAYGIEKKKSVCGFLCVEYIVRIFKILGFMLPQFPLCYMQTLLYPQ